MRYHISGQLKVAPEHVSDEVLKYMGKPCHAVYQQFVRKYQELNQREHMDQYVVPYLMSSHPGCTMAEAVKLAEYLRDIHHQPEQVQDFYPTPSTLSTVMYYTGLDPRAMQPVYVPRDPHEKAMQRALMQYKDPKNYKLVREALILAGREDLIGYGPECLIRPPRGAGGNGKKSPPPRKRAQTEKQPHPKRIPQNAAENRCSRRPMVAPTFINGSAIGSVGRALPARKAPLDCIKGSWRAAPEGIKAIGG